MSEHMLLTIQQYATKHKMSTFAVIKLINAKKLRVIKKTVDDEEKEFIVDDSIPSQTEKAPQQEHQSTPSSSIDYEVEFHKLLAKYVELNEKYTKLMEEKSSIK